MNRELLNPFEPEYPEFIEVVLEDEYASICEFDRFGNMLATARVDGYLYIWDVLTLGLIRKYKFSPSGLTCLSWSSSSDYILVGNEAGECIMWNLKNDSCTTIGVFSARINNVKIISKQCNIIFVCAEKSTPSFILIKSDALDEKFESVPVEFAPRLLADNKTNGKISTGTCSVLDKTGKYVYMGTSNGYIYLVNIETYKIVDFYRIGNSAIVQIAHNPLKSEIAVNCGDRIIRVYGVEILKLEEQKIESLKLALITKIQDLISRAMWCGVYFSSSGEHIIVGSHHKAEHNLYIWDKFSTSIVHPFRPIVASISNVGVIYLWTRTPQQNWSAFDRNFKELDRNIDYEEPENEFDLSDEIAIREMKKQQAASMLQDEPQDEIVDVTSIEPLYGLDNDNDNTPETVFFHPPIYLHYEKNE